MIVIMRVWTIICVLIGGAVCRAADWPQFLGPSRELRTSGEGLMDTFPPGGPKVVWKRPVGAGWSGPVVAARKLILFHRLDDHEVIECLDTATGQAIWKAKYPATYRDDFGFEEGPRSTPAVDAKGNRIFTLGADGHLSCFALDTGKQLWQNDTRRELKADKGFFGMVCSPLLEGDSVIVNLGGARGKNQGAGIAAFEQTSGKLLWQATNHEAGYSSPVIATIAEQRYLIDFTRAGLVAIEPGAGKVLWEVPFRARMHASVNAASPVVAGDLIFISASYGTGASLFQFTPTTPKEIWRSDEALSAHYATPVHHEGHLYGFDGRQEQGCNLRCIELKSGKVKWNQEGFGAGTLMLAGNRLFILSEKGELTIASASPEKFNVIGKASILAGECRAYPALANGFYFARDKEILICVDLRKTP